ncbi:MAG: type II toxin-antitoxin system VapC family toxin [Defluviicoccus sp.]|nr:type II toxin-antitoxin system VapC family toxin [Defluviicoccus sp.]MDE0385702.1 type II toxin-antitoxin system VapC family toxin [Defluviicoccus sp.]
MIVDTSAIFAVLFNEPDARRYATALQMAPRRRMSVANALEAFIVAESRGGAASGEDIDRFFQRFAIELEPVTTEQLIAARRAWRRFGRGNHPAALNFGDCFAYALAETTGEKLLYKGGDFARTDVKAA